MSAVNVTSLERRFGYTPVLSKLALVVEAGERVTITGPNGSGKTTLLRVLSGLLKANAGRIEVLGSTPRNEDVRRRIGVIGHMPALYPRMTPSENLRFWGRLYDDRDAEERGREILTRLGIDTSDKRPVASYSQGMRQRVAVARALCTAPELVIADEPLAALDEDGARIVASMLGDGRTLIAATHDVHRFEGSRRLALVDGRLRPVV